MQPGSLSTVPAEQPRPTTGRRKWPRRVRWVIFAACLLGALYAAHGWILSGWATFLNAAGPLEAAEYAMILGGDSTIRPFVAATLVKHGLAKRVLVVQPWLSADAEEGAVPPEHILNQRVLLQQGVPPQDLIFLPGDVTSTYDEARALDRFLKDKPRATVNVVTSNFHIRRAGILFRRILGERMNQVRFVAAPTDGFDESNWWMIEEGSRTYAVETVKLLHTLCAKGR